MDSFFVIVPSFSSMILWYLYKKQKLQKNDLEKSLQEALFYRDEFLSIASHELKTPLTSLKLQSQIFKRSIGKKDPEAYSPERVDRLVGESERQVLRLNRLVDDMLDISRIRTGKLSFVKETLSINLLMSEVIDKHRPELTNHTFETTEMLSADKARLEQVFSILLSNAFKYGNGLPVEVNVKQSKGAVQISITDKGIGIPDEEQTRIFRRFERAIPASEVSGLGLGLFIAKQIVEAHGGEISLKSKLHRGSTFKVTLPLEKNFTHASIGRDIAQ